VSSTHLAHRDQFLFFKIIFRWLVVCSCGEPSLKGGLGLASAVFIGPKSHGTYDHIFTVSRLRPPPPNLEGQLAVFIFPKVKVKVMLRLTVSQSISMSWCQVHSGTCDQIVFSAWKLLCCFCGRPLWREIGSVSCQSLSSVFSSLSKIQYNLHCTCYIF
jgi:hypothetical protein